MNSGHMEELKRYLGVVAEGFRNEIRQVAEGHGVIRNEIKALHEEKGLSLYFMDHGL